jgi:hypothetical protein
MSRVMCRVTCQGTRTRGVGEVADDKSRDEPSQCETHEVGVVDDELRDVPRDMLRHQNARRR